MKTTRLNPAEELQAAIRTAASEADPHTTSREAAARFYEDERELIAQFADEWIVQKLASLISKHRAKTRRENDKQLAFEESLGFRRLPARLEAEDGKTVPRAEATINTFRRLVRSIKQQDNPVLNEAQRAVALMAKYTTHKKRIKWREVLQKEAEAMSKAIGQQGTDG